MMNMSSRRSGYVKFVLSALVIVTSLITFSTSDVLASTSATSVEPNKQYKLYSGYQNLYYSTLGELITDFVQKERARFDKCMASAEGELYWACSKKMAKGIPGPASYNEGFKNGEPHSYQIPIETFFNVKHWDGHETYSEDAGAIGATTSLSCNYPYLYRWEGPSSDGKVWCEVTEQPEKDRGKPPCDNPTNPINLATGNKYQKEVDFRSGSTGLSDFIRHYNSIQTNHLFGIVENWSHNYSSNVDHFKGIDGLATESLSFNRPDGRTFIFSKRNGVWVGDSDVTDAVKDYVDDSGVHDGWDYITAANSIERYDLTGKLLSIISPDGRSQTLSYDADDRLASVTGTYGHTLSFAYDTTGRMNTVTDPNNEIYTYSYDANNNLITVEYPDTTTRQYLYEDVNFPNALTGIINENGDRFASWTYDLLGRAVSSEHADGHDRYDVTYNAGNSSTLTDSKGNITTYSFEQMHSVYKTTSVQGDACSSCSDQDAAKSYDANGFLASRTDQNGNVTTYVNNTRGLEISRTEASGTSDARTITTEWHAEYRLPIKIARPSVAAGQREITTIAYNDVMHPKLPTTITRTGFKPDGTAMVARSISLSYTTDGRIAQIDGPRTDVSDITTMTYYANDATEGHNRGQLKNVSNALDQKVSYDSYDAYGNVLQQTDANGSVTAYMYDSRQRLLSMTVTPVQGTARTTSYSYDGIGQLVSTTMPVGITMTYGYDAAKNLSSVTDNLGNRIDYAYDLKGNLTNEITKDADGILARLVDTIYDSRDRVDSINAAGSLTSFVYDGVGNLTGTNDPNNNTPTSHRYDALNRLMETVDTLAGTTSYDYDVNDRVIAVTAPNNTQTSYAYDDLGNLLSEQSPDRGIRTYIYNAAGNLLSLIDARNINVTYNYDALGRVTGIDYPGTAEDVSFIYDVGIACTFGIGRLCSMLDESGATDYAYDGFGNVVTQNKTELGITYTTSYDYDAGDNISGIIYPGGRIVTMNRDLISRIAAITATVNDTAQTMVSDVQYRADNLVTAQTFGNGIEESRSYDLQGRLLEQGSNISQAGVPDTTTVSLTPAITSPSPSGSSIIFTAQASDSGAYAYQFSLQGPGTGNIQQVVKPFSLDKTWQWNTTSADNGDSNISVEMRLAGSPNGASKSAAILYTIGVGPVESVSLNTSNISPTIAGTTTQFTASAVGGSGNTEYRFTLNGPSTSNIPLVVQNYSTVNTWDWSSLSTQTGTYTITVDSRNIGSTQDSEATNSLSHTLDAQIAATALNVIIDPVSPQKSGTTISLTATASGGNVGLYEYKFRHRGPDTANVWVDTEYSPSNIFTLPTTEASSVGTHYFYVYTRNKGSTSTVQVSKYITYTINTSVEPANALTVDFAPLSPGIAGSPVILTATASGGNIGVYEYRFRHRGPDTANVWVDTPYSLSNTLTLPTTEANSVGTHYFYVYARNVGSTKTYEAYKYISNYSVKTSIDPPTAVAVDFTPLSPGIAGSPVILTATATGGNVGEYEYRFRHRGPDTANVWVDTPYSLSNTLTLPTTEANSVGTHYFYVYARSVGSATPTEVSKYISNYSVKTSIDPPTAVAVDFAPLSPAIAGNTITLTATASGGNVGEYEYRFRHRGPDTANVWVDTPYSLSNTLTLPTTEANSVGTHYFYVYARSVGSATPTEVSKYISNYYVNSSVAKLDTNFLYVNQKVLTRIDADVTQVAIIRQAKGDDYDYWLKSPATTHQWQQLSGVTALGDVEPDTLVYIDKTYLDVWYRSDVDNTAYRYQRISAPTEKEQATRYIKTAVGDPLLATRSYSYDANGNVTDITTPAGIHGYGYDALDRIVNDAIPSVDSIGFGYDANGNRTADTQGLLSNNYGYGAGSNQLNVVNGQTVNRDAAGNTTVDSSPISGGSRTFEYNNANRLFKVYEAGGLAATYTYNALGQRTRKITPTSTTVYHYDLQGQLISETQSDGRSIRDIIWQGIEPVAQIDVDGATETVTYLHTDHLATPRSATDETGAVVWSWNSDAFGSTAASGSVTVNLRFPGQYYDSETQLHYNWNRYYDPRIGRYITSDPIGLDGGLNTFGYVGGNPLGFVDPTGEVLVLIGRAITLIRGVGAAGARVGPRTGRGVGSRGNPVPPPAIPTTVPTDSTGETDKPKECKDDCDLKFIRETHSFDGKNKSCLYAGTGRSFTFQQAVGFSCPPINRETCMVDTRYIHDSARR